MSLISVSHLSKAFKIHKKETGLMGSIRSFFHRQYSITKAVNDISFSIGEGELIGFIGPNGAGKTTTLKCLSGLLYPSGGIVEVLGFTPFDRKHNYLKKIALVMGQKNQLWWDLPAIETFRLNKEIYEINDSQYKKTLDTLVDLLKVSSVLHTQVRKLSLGERMKMELIASLIHSPKVLFLDEPTIGLDVVMQKNLRDFIRTYNESTRSTIILTSHYMEDVRQLCKRVIVIDHGSIVYDGELDSLVKKYATHKVLDIVFDKEVAKEKLTKIGEIISYEFPKVTLRVNREHSNHVASLILSEFPVVDLNITEPDIEDIIRDVFTTIHT
jgi:ABC-2 type transport system ATP-binding protein